MQRKTSQEQCERLRNLNSDALRSRCARFVADHSGQITAARPAFPSALHDRATDIWEPLFALADLAGGDWPALAREAALSLSAAAQDTNPASSLLLDILLVFAAQETDRIFTRHLLGFLSRFSDRPWTERRNGKPLTDVWLAQQLNPYGIRPKTIWIGQAHAKGYLQQDFDDAFKRYVPNAEFEAYLAESKAPTTPAAPAAEEPLSSVAGCAVLPVESVWDGKGQSAAVEGDGESHSARDVETYSTEGEL